MAILGLHHITLVSSNVQKTSDFYGRILGLRLIKKTVNFDDPGSYHLYFSDETGKTTAITFFEWQGAVRGYPGIGGTHHFALQVADEDGLSQWKRRLTGMGIEVSGPANHKYFHSISFHDPDGASIEIATIGPGWAGPNEDNIPGTQTHQAAQVRQTAGQKQAQPLDSVPEITPEMALGRGMHHITTISSDIQRTHAFYTGLLGLQRVNTPYTSDDPESAQWYWGVDGGKPGSLISSFECKIGQEKRARMGSGQTHHFALAVRDDESQLEWREKLLSAGLRVSPVMNRIYFKSIYTNDPDGHIVELATLGPGFQADETQAELGQGLMLPPWLEPERASIEAGLRPINSVPQISN
jgi:glyoxalase family protein